MNVKGSRVRPHHPRISARKSAGTLLTILLVAMLAACGSKEESTAPSTGAPGWKKMPELTYLNDFPVEDHMTERVAQNDAVNHLTETLRPLPAEWLLKAGYEWEGSRGEARKLDKCTFDKQTPHAPYGLWISYELVGGSDNTADYVPALHSAWQSLGWAITHPADDPGVLRATTPDHFSLTTSQAPKTGQLMITVTTPCFPEANRDGADPLPDPIRHP